MLKTIHTINEGDQKFMNEAPLISVIVPAYNCEKYIESCIESLTGQTYKNIEIIVVDDGSTDKTPGLIDELAKNDSRIKVIHKENGGVSEARNVALDNVTGEYVTFSDADDINSKDKIEFLYRIITKYNSDISHCGYYKVTENEKKAVNGTGRVYVQSKEEALRCIIQGTLFEGSLCTKLFKSKLLNGIRFDTELKDNEDILVCFLAFERASSSVYADVPKYQYIIRNTSACRTMSRLKSSEDCAKVSGIMLEHCDRSFLYQSSVSRHVANLLKLYRYSRKENKEEAKETRKALKKMIDDGIASNKYRHLAKLAYYAPHLYILIYGIAR